ncbi:MAG: hypothetical protein ACK53P_11205 [Pseudanabaena sp.]
MAIGSGVAREFWVERSPLRELAKMNEIGDGYKNLDMLEATRLDWELTLRDLLQINERIGSIQYRILD